MIAGLNNGNVSTAVAMWTRMTRVAVQSSRPKTRGSISRSAGNASTDEAVHKTLPRSGINWRGHGPCIPDGHELADS
jgi:hypothetical protein